MEGRIYSRYRVFSWTKDFDNGPALKAMADANDAKELQVKLQQIVDRHICRRGDIVVNWPPIEGIVVGPAPDFIVSLPDDLE